YYSGYFVAPDGCRWDVFFFFSSRRRHTISKRDWSSDVCSSDLSIKEYGNDHYYIKTQGYQITVVDPDPDSLIADDLEDHFTYCAISQYFVNDNLNHVIRSEERRVGKECRSHWCGEHLDK